MFKKIAVGLLSLVLVAGTVGAFGAARAQAQIGNISISQLVELFISLGIIGPDKAAAARAAIASTGSSDTVSSATQLVISVDPANFPAADVVATAGSNNNQYYKLPMLALDARAQGDTMEIADLAVSIHHDGNAVPTAAYLYDGSTLLGSASVNNSTGIATFTNINYWIQRDTTKVLTVKADIDSVDSLGTDLSVSVLTSNIKAVNNSQQIMTVAGSAESNTVRVRNAGLVATLSSATITKAQTAMYNSHSTTTVDATFNVTLQAVGGDIYFGTQSAAQTFLFDTYRDGQWVSPSAANTVSWSVPAYGVVTNGLPNGVAFKLTQNNSVTIPVDYIFEGRVSTGQILPAGNYAVGLESIRYATSAHGPYVANSSMSGNQSWRTSSVYLADDGSNSNQPGSAVSSASIVMQGTPTLALTYSAGKEAQLTATFNVAVKAGNTLVSIFTNSANVHFTQSSTGKLASANSIRATVGVAQGEKTDSYGRNYTTVSPGQTLAFTVTLTADPKQLFAGSYNAALNGLYQMNPNDPGSATVLSAPSNSTNYVTIVGETTPYMTSVTNTVAAGNTVYVSGQRLDKVSSIWIDGLNTGVGFSVPTGGTSLTFVAPPSLSTGNHTLVLKDNDGQSSNPVGFNISGSVSSVGVTVTPIGTPALTLSYDSSNKESALTGAQAFNVTAGNSDAFVVYGTLNLLENTGVVSPHGLFPNGTQYTFSGTWNTLQTTMTDSQGNVYTGWKVKAGQTGSFIAKFSADPKQMYAGNYSLSYGNVTLLNNGSYSYQPLTIANSPHVTIIGEKASVPSVTTQPMSVSCYSSPSDKTNVLAWNASASGGSGSYNYSWSVYNDVVNYGAGSTQSSFVSVQYGSYGTKQAVVRVTDSAGTNASATCSGTIAAPVSTVVGPVSATPTPALTPVPALTPAPQIVNPSLSTYSWYVDDPSTWPIVSTPSSLNSNQAVRVKALTGEQYFDKALGVSSGRITSSPPVSTSQLVLYVYDYAKGDYATEQKIVNVSITNKPVAQTSPAPTASTNPTTSFSISQSSISLGQSITLTSTTNSPSGTLQNAAIDESTDNSNWSSGAPCGYWSNSGTDNNSHTISCSFTPPTAGTYYFRSRGSDSTGASSFVTQTLNVGLATSMNPSQSNVAAASVGIDQLIHLLQALR